MASGMLSAYATAASRHGTIPYATSRRTTAPARGDHSFGLSVPACFDAVRPPVLPAVFDLVRWKRTRLVSLLGEVATDEQSVQFLLRQPEPQLQYAKHWLKVKAARVDGQVARWFSEKTTIVSLVVLTFSSVQDFGGLPWLEKTLAQSMHAGNFLNVVILVALVFVFGASLGAMMLKVLRERYAYQLELVELALTLKSLAQDKSSAAPQAVSPPPSAPGALRRMLRTLRRR
jgi:hypothetical protein